jgi:hypothetical protein
MQADPDSHVNKKKWKNDPNLDCFKLKINWGMVEHKT